jgi:ubiquinone/menaquinone biosynthesis C-methylase UbiE
MNQAIWRLGSTAQEYSFFLEHSRDRAAESLTLRFMPPECNRAIDLGCGPGTFTERMASHAGAVVGLDLSEAALSQIDRQTQHTVRPVLGDASQLPFDRASFDFVTSMAVLHETDLAQVLPAVRKILAPGGRLVLWDLVAGPTMAGWRAVFTSFGAFRKSYGWRAAVRMSRFMVSREWSLHNQGQELPSIDDFKSVYSHHFPGCRFVERPYLVGVFWEAPLKNRE